MADKPAAKKPITESQESLYQKAVKKMNADSLIVQYAYKIDNYNLAAAMFEEVGDYLDAPELAVQCREKAEETRKESLAVGYEKALAKQKKANTQDRWLKAKAEFEALGDYRDAPEHVKECQSVLDGISRKAFRKRVIGLGILAVIVIFIVAGSWSGLFHYMMGYGFFKAKMYAQAETVFESMPGFLNSDQYNAMTKNKRLETAELGNVISFGEYHWKLIGRDRANHTITLIAADVGPSHPFYQVPFNDTPEPVSWADSSLRAWLNSEFLEEAFTEQERSMLVLQTSEPSVNEKYGTAYEETTQDYLTLISVEESAQYMEYLKALGMDFWMRTPGATMENAAFIAASHVIRTYGYPVNADDMMVRPVIKVDYSALLKED